MMNSCLLYRLLTEFGCIQHFWLMIYVSYKVQINEIYMNIHMRRSSWKLKYRSASRLVKRCLPLVPRKIESPLIGQHSAVRFSEVLYYNYCNCYWMSTFSLNRSSDLKCYVSMFSYGIACEPIAASPQTVSMQPATCVMAKLRPSFCRWRRLVGGQVLSCEDGMEVL